LQAVLVRNRFDGAILMVGGLPFPETGPHIIGVLVRQVDADHHTLDECGRDSRFRGVCASLERGIPAIAEELARRGLPLDVEMRPEHFPALLAFAERLPNLRIAIDHLARPTFQAGPTDDWLRGMEAAARLPNVFCKISGLLTEVEQLPWKAAPIRPFAQHVLAVFGPQRLMFGSEWPVRLPDVTWKESLAAFTQSIGAQSMEVREQLLGGTAAEFYRAR
jgi:predicted TIM-barrel fold metal-dependent hydrolase